MCVAGITVALVFGLSVAAAWWIPSPLSWRVKLVSAKLSGHIQEIPWRPMLRWIRPGTPVYLEALSRTLNVHDSITNLLTDRNAAAEGEKTFARVCARCHGEDALGGAGPNLTAAVGSLTDWSFFSTVYFGRPGTGMMAQPIEEREIWAIQLWLRERALKIAGARGESVGEIPKAETVTAADLLSPQRRPGDWLTYSGAYDGHRHAPLPGIDRKNVGDLKLAWVVQLRSVDASLESSPIIDGGLMFVTESPEGVVALDARSGEVIWKYRRPIPEGAQACCGQRNRGVAVLGKVIFIATLDAHLLALDASSGRVLWDTVVADYRSGYSITAAPLAIGDEIVTGTANGDISTANGIIAAYSALDGTLRWRFITVPQPGEPGSETWGGDPRKRGGAQPWMTGSYDPQLDLIYWGTGNPSPSLNSAARPGDNLHSCSIVALDARTGALRWSFQFSPGDDHDYDAAHVPVLADLDISGNRSRVVLSAVKNGFFYVLDRATGHFIRATAFVRQNWAEGITADGRPIPREAARPRPQGTLVWPSTYGATNWWTPSYDAERGLMFVPTLDAATIFFSGDAGESRDTDVGGMMQKAPQPVAASIRAIDVRTGTIRWVAELGKNEPPAKVAVGGLLSTSTGLVFGGYRNNFSAFDADTGHRLWNINLGGYINAPPVSFEIDHEPYIAVAAGHALFVFKLGSHGAGDAQVAQASSKRNSSAAKKVRGGEATAK